MYSTTLSHFSLHQWKQTTIIYIQRSLIDFIRGSVCSAQYIYIYCQPSNCSPTGEYQRQVGRTMWCRDLANCVLHHLIVNSSKSNVELSPRSCLQNLQVCTGFMQLACAATPKIVPSWLWQNFTLYRLFFIRDAPTARTS